MKTQNNPFQSRKGHFLVYFNRARVGVGGPTSLKFAHVICEWSPSNTSRGGGGPDDIYTSMEALHSYHVDQRRPARKPRVKVLPDFANLDPFKPKPSRTNPNVMFKRPSSMSSLMY